MLVTLCLLIYIFMYNFITLAAYVSVAQYDQEQIGRKSYPKAFHSKSEMHWSKCLKICLL